MRKIKVKSISCRPFDKTYVQCRIQTHFVTNEYIRNKNLFKNRKYPSTMVWNIMYSEPQPPPLGGSQTSGFGTDDIGYSCNLWSAMLSKFVMFVIESLTCVINSHCKKQDQPCKIFIHVFILLKPGIICTFLIHFGSLQKMLTALFNIVQNTQKSKWKFFLVPSQDVSQY